MENKLINFFNENNLIYQNKTFVLAVSTGMDSAVMFDAFIEFKKKHNINIIVAHVNHHMREQSEIEEKYIVEICEKLNIPCYVKELYFEKEESNFEATARKLRYEFFINLVSKVKADFLVLAHHANDNVETIMMRIMRGSSLAGYAGMQEVTNMKGVAVIRPFLNVSKEEIINYQREKCVVYFEDESNSSSDYTRNRIRKEIIPKMLNESHDLIHKFSEFRETIYEASLIINSVRDEFINKFVSENNGITIDRIEFLKLNNYMREEVLFEILKPFSLSKANIKELIRIIESNVVNYNNKFKGLFNFIIEYGFVKISNQECNKYTGEIIIDKPGEYYLGDKKIVCVLEKNNKNNYNLNEMWYNTTELPITIRYRNDGDKILVNGLNKNLNKLFIDLKVPMSLRDSTVLACKDGEVLMAFGIKKSDLLIRSAIEKNIKIMLLEE